eukprot:TRINITY_DN6857_c1_g1_i1.p1 TRINITY_DN6857_c1_g1~~TRINITY_DN6857_c1_g1_i1.p1  ORF type:complete len:642 (+),score=133.54 TRINITY_DN6857_c1_g1_i1:115-2040(+)
MANWVPPSGLPPGVTPPWLPTWWQTDPRSLTKLGGQKCLEPFWFEMREARLQKDGITITQPVHYHQFKRRLADGTDPHQVELLWESLPEVRWDGGGWYQHRYFLEIYKHQGQARWEEAAPLFVLYGQGNLVRCTNAWGWEPDSDPPPRELLNALSQSHNLADVSTRLSYEQLMTEKTKKWQLRYSTSTTWLENEERLLRNRCHRLILEGGGVHRMLDEAAAHRVAQLEQSPVSSGPSSRVSLPSFARTPPGCPSWQAVISAIIEAALSRWIDFNSIGFGGWTTEELTELLESDESVRRAIRGFMGLVSKEELDGHPDCLQQGVIRAFLAACDPAVDYLHELIVEAQKLHGVHPIGIPPPDALKELKKAIMQERHQQPQQQQQQQQQKERQQPVPFQHPPQAYQHDPYQQPPRQQPRQPQQQPPRLTDFRLWQDAQRQKPPQQEPKPEYQSQPMRHQHCSAPPWSQQTGSSTHWGAAGMPCGDSTVLSGSSGKEMHCKLTRGQRDGNGASPQHFDAVAKAQSKGMTGSESGGKGGGADGPVVDSKKKEKVSPKSPSAPDKFKPEHQLRTDVVLSTAESAAAKAKLLELAEREEEAARGKRHSRVSGAHRTFAKGELLPPPRQPRKQAPAGIHISLRRGRLSW